MFHHVRALLNRYRKRQNPEGVMNIFRKKYTNFKALLESNAELLKIIAGIEEKLAGQQVFGMAYIRSEMARMTFHAARMISSFEGLSGHPAPELKAQLNELQNIITAELELKNTPRGLAFVLPYDRISKEMLDFVGGKNANLGEINSRVHLPIPAGFAITTTAFDEFMEYNDLVDEIRKQKMALNFDAPESIIQVSNEIRRLFLGAEIPPRVAQTIHDAFHAYIGSTGKAALRSSAIGEDSTLSFAGQYQSFLNVPLSDVLFKYKEVLASLFSPQAISYRHHMGISFEDAAMSVACLAMIPSRAGGVIYTRHPLRPIQDNVIINAAWGLGSVVVDGTITPDAYILSKTNPPLLLETAISSKPSKLIMGPDGTLRKEAVPDDEAQSPCLSESQAIQLAEWALRLEAHFQYPQDIEWAADPDGDLIILQTRPLLIEGEKGAFFSTRRFDQYPLLLEGGNVACPGVACGKVHIVHSDDDLLSFPEGGILVAAHPSPQYVLVMEKAHAIITNSGSIAGHMASVAREFKVPTVLNLKNAMSVLRPGMLITVDAFMGVVYEGHVTELTEMQWERGPFMKDTPVYQVLQKLSQHIVPLNLTNPKSRRFIPKNCRTIHDIMRLTHELSYTEIFQISDYTTDHGKISVKLDALIPIDLYVIDLGGGLEGMKNTARIKPDQVVSAPFKALIKGMLHKELKAFEPRPVNFRGFLSVVSEQMLSPPNPVVERFGDRSYAIISDKYLNFSSRVGYHYSILDSYCGRGEMKNYINFQFKGGAANDVRRNRRARLIRKILERGGFLVEVQGDRVNARLAKMPHAVIEEKLDLLGRLTIYTRQMDMLMNSEESVSLLAENFLEEKYDLTVLHRPPDP